MAMLLDTAWHNGQLGPCKRRHCRILQAVNKTVRRCDLFTFVNPGVRSLRLPPTARQHTAFGTPRHNARIDRAPDSPTALHNELLRGIAAQGGVKRYSAHAVIISEGDMADTLFIILTSRVKV